MSLTRHIAALAAGLALAAGAAGVGFAQVRQPGETRSAGEDSGPLSDVSTNVGAGSRSVHDGALTIGETSGGPVRSGPIRDATTRSMLSGPVSSMSQGPVYEPRPSLSGGSMTEASAGAVKHDTADPLGTRISDPLRELGPLQAQMRERRQQAEQDALARAAEPAVVESNQEAAELANEPVPEVGFAPDELAIPEAEPGSADEAAYEDAPLAPAEALEGAAPSAP